MGFGQYSAMGSFNRTKTDMLNACGISPEWSRKAGKNRVHYRLADGSQGFILHETIIARVDAGATALTLNDGGWPSMTTRAAFSEAAAAFGLPQLGAGGGRPHSAHTIGFYVDSAWGWDRVRFDREVTIAIREGAYVAAVENVGPPSIRAILNEGDATCMVYYSKGAFRSDNGVTIAARPRRALQMLHAVLRIAARGRGRIAYRREPLYPYAEEVAGYPIVPASMGRTVHIGCHSFRVEDVRGMLNRMARDYPAHADAVAKEARKLARADKIATDAKEARMRAEAQAAYRRSLAPEARA
ncbi:hypothetical protein [EBPR siphovirus 5]|nr:hypothetical protein [EBPR siphovirus 5]